MTLFIVPVTYIIDEEQEITTEIHTAQALTGEEAREIVKGQVIELEKELHDGKDYIPAIWLEEEQFDYKGNRDEEGYQIGPAYKLVSGIPFQESESLWKNADGSLKH